MPTTTSTPPMSKKQGLLLLAITTLLAVNIEALGHDLSMKFLSRLCGG